MNFESGGDPGLMLKDGIIFLAESLTLSDSAPGYLAGLFLLLTLGVGLLYFVRTSRQIQAIRELDSRVRKHEDIATFAAGYDEFKAGLRETYQTNYDSKAIWNAFVEFDETVVADDLDGPLRLRNSIRPANFLNIEDLEFGPGFYRILPNLFVSAGLFLTFLGLVAALHQFSQSMNSGTGGMDQAMQGFMQIASAKFVMSLIGLFCSILLTMLLRERQNRIDASLNHLCSGIERRLVFVSLEDIGFRQLRAATEQRKQLQEMATRMVADLQKPLDALPDRITGAIADRMDPIFEKVASMGTSNMEGMVGDLSKQLSQSVGNALTRASESLSEATDRIGLMVDRMDGTQAQAGNGLRDAVDQMSKAMADMRSEVAASGRTATEAMTTGADRLLSVMNDTLNGIRENTGQGATAMRSAAEEMRSAAEGFRDALTTASEESAEAARRRMTASSEEAGKAITGAGSALLESFNKTSSDISGLGAQVGDGLREALAQMSKTLADLGARVTVSGQTATDAMNAGADRLLSVMNETLSGIRDNTGQGAEAMRAAADEMRRAAEGFRDTLANASEASAEAARQRIATSTEEAGQAITGAGRSLLESFNQTSADIAKLGTEMGGVIGDELLSRLEEVSGRLSEFADAVQQGASGAQKAALGMNNGADAINTASTGFRGASQTLTAAFDPIRASQERIEITLRRVGELVETVSETLMQNSASVAENAAHVLDTAQTALGTEREGIRRNLEATRASIAQLSQEAVKLDQIDAMLGRALTQYNSQLEAALGNAQDYVSRMRDTLQPGLDTLQNVVAQAEQFMPQSRGRT